MGMLKAINMLKLSVGNKDKKNAFKCIQRSNCAD